MPKLLLIALLCSSVVKAAPQSVRDVMAEAKLVGEGRLSYMFWDIYDGELYAPEGEYQEGQPAALTLHYLRDIDAEEMVERITKELKKIGVTDKDVLREWEDKMAEIFPSVEEGDSVSAIVDDSQHISFFHNQKRIGEIESQDFSRQFFRVWLSENTSEPQLRLKLLGKTD